MKAKPRKHPKTPAAREPRAPAGKKIPKVPDASRARARKIDFTAGRPPEWPDPTGDLALLVARRADLAGMIACGTPFDVAVKLVNQRDALKAANPAPPSSSASADPATSDTSDTSGTSGKRGPTRNCTLESAEVIIKKECPRMPCSVSTIKNWNRAFRNEIGYCPEGWNPDLLDDRIRLRGWAAEHKEKIQLGLKTINRYPDRVPGATAKRTNMKPGEKETRPLVDGNAEGERMIDRLTRKGL